MQVQDHDEFPEFDHRALPPANGSSIGEAVHRRTFQGMPWKVRRHENWGTFKCDKWGELIRRCHGGLLAPAVARAIEAMPRDNPAGIFRALRILTRIVEASTAINGARKLKMAEKVITACGDVAGKTIAILGLAFKQNTADMRQAPSIGIIKSLQDAGARIQAYDPQAMEQARPLMLDVDFRHSAYACAEGASALVIVTEGDAFRALEHWPEEHEIDTSGQGIEFLRKNGKISL
jgi:hypothetical protein